MRPPLPYCRTSTSTHRECRSGYRLLRRVLSLRRRTTSPHKSPHLIRTMEVVSTPRRIIMLDTCKACRTVPGRVSTSHRRPGQHLPGRQIRCRPNKPISNNSSLTRNVTIKCDCSNTCSRSRQTTQRPKVVTKAVRSIPWLTPRLR